MVELTKVETRSWMMAVGDKRPGARYAVSVDGKLVGHVEKQSESSYRSDGMGSRLRYGLRGYSVTWRVTSIAGERIGYCHYTRKSAVNALIESLV